MWEPPGVRPGDLSPLAEGRELKYPRRQPQANRHVSPLAEGRELKYFRHWKPVLRTSPLAEGRELKCLT